MANPTRVNTSSLFGSSSGGAFSVSIPFNLLAGDVIAVTVDQVSTAVGSVKDSVNGVDFTLVGGPQAATNSSSTNGVWFAYETPQALSSGFTVTVTPGAGATAASAAIDILRGASDTIDQAAVTSAPARGTTFTGPALGSAATSGTLVWTGVVESSTSALGIGSGSPYSAGSSGTTQRAAMNAFVLGANGSSTYALSGTCAKSTVSLAACVVSFQAAGSAPPVSGSGGITTGAVSLSGVGTETISGSGAVTTRAVALSGSGAVTASGVTGSGGITTQHAALHATGTTTVTGSGGLTAHHPTLSGAGAETITGSGGVATHHPVFALVGTEIVAGSGGMVTKKVQLSGSSGAAPVSGSGALTLHLVALAGVGSVVANTTAPSVLVPDLREAYTRETNCFPVYSDVWREVQGSTTATADSYRALILEQHRETIDVY